MSMRYHTPLTAEEQLAAGLPAPRTLALADRVRYAELDPLNHVNNKSYFTWFETLRVEYGLRCVLPFFDVVPRMVPDKTAPVPDDCDCFMRTERVCDPAPR